MSEGIVTIATFMNPVQADFARSILEMEGIECWLIDEAMCNVAPAYVFAVGGVKLQVRKSDAPRAVAALQRKESTGKEGHTDRDDTSYPSSRPDDEADSLPERTALMKPGELPEFVKNLPEAGDSYFIPAGIEHHGRLGTGFRAVDCFADRDRYSPRKV